MLRYRTDNESSSGHNNLGVRMELSEKESITSLKMTPLPNSHVVMEKMKACKDAPPLSNRIAGHTKGDLRFGSRNKMWQ